MKMLMSFYNLVENAEVYGYPRGGEPLKNNRLTEKKNGWRPWNGWKLIETTELNSQKGHIPFTAITAKWLKQKSLRFQEQNTKDLSLKKRWLQHANR